MIIQWNQETGLITSQTLVLRSWSCPSYLHSPRVSDQVSRQLQSPDVWHLGDFLRRRSGLLVGPAERPHPEESWRSRDTLSCDCSLRLHSLVFSASRLLREISGNTRLGLLSTVCLLFEAGALKLFLLSPKTKH